MSVYVVTSDDTLTLYGRVIADQADGEVSKISFPDTLGDVKTGKNGNSLFADNQKGNNAELTLRLARGSSDDQFLQNKLTEQKSNFVGMTLAYGSFVKMLGDGQGNIVSDSVTLTAGMFTKPVESVENVEGNTDQAVAVYTLKFARADRGIK